MMAIPLNQMSLATFQMETTEFKKAIKSFLAQNRVNHSDNVKRIGFEALRRVILRTTRVDTGRMRNGWHICQDGDTLVFSDKGVKKLSEVSEGDMLYGPGKFQRVARKWKFDSPPELVEIHKRGFGVPLKVTPNHVFPVIRFCNCPHFKSYKYRCRKNCCHHKWNKYLHCEKLYEKEKIIECKAKDIDVETMALISYPFDIGSIDNAELMRLAGYYLAEGFIVKGRKKDTRLVFSVNNQAYNIHKDLRCLMRNLFEVEKDYTQNGDGTLSINFRSEEAVVFLSQFGRGAYNKKIPTEILLNYSATSLNNLLKGLIAGDGWIEPRRRQVFLKTVSPHIASSVCLILESQNCSPHVFQPRTFHSSDPKGKQIKQNYKPFVVGFPIREAYELGIIEEGNSIKSRWKQETARFLSNGVIARPIKQKKIIPSNGSVYDVTMEGEPIYWSNGIASHNSFHNPSTWVPPPVPMAKKGQTQKLSNEPRPDPGSDRNLMFLYLQNNVFYAPEHEFGSRRVSPLLMLTQTIAELRGEMQKFLTDGTSIIWNKEINGITGKGLSKAGKLNKRQFMQRFESRRQRRRNR